MEQQIRQFQQHLEMFLSFSSSSDMSNKQGNLKEIQRNLVTISKQNNFIDICSIMLLNYELSQSSLILTASMLKDKFIYQFNSFTQDNITAIHNNMRQIIAKFKNPKKHLLVQFCLCITYLYLNCACKIVSLINYVTSFITEGINGNYFFKILELIPQQIFNGKLILQDETRQSIRMILNKQQQNVLVLLNTTSPKIWQLNEVKKQYLIGCFSSWIGIGYNIQIINSLHKHFLLNKVFQCMIEGILSQQCGQCLLQILSQINNPNENKQIFTYIANNIHPLLQCTDHLLAQMQLIDADKYIKVLCDFGIKSIPMLLSSSQIDPSTSIYLTKMIHYLDCTNGQIYQLCHFWLCFVEQAKKNHKSNQIIIEIIKNVYNNLIKQSCYRWQLFYKLNQISQHNLANIFNSADQILDIRSITKQVFYHIGQFLGKQNYLEFIMLSMTTLPHDHNEIFLPYLETYIFSLKKVMKKFPRITPSVIKIVYTYKELQITSVPLLRSYLNLMSSFMTICQKNQEFIQQLFVYISQNFNNKMLSSKAEKAFCQGCRQNPQILCKYIDNLFELLKQYPCKRNLIRGISLILNSNIEIMRNYLPQILKLQLEIFNNSQTPIARKQSINSIITIIRTISQNKDTTIYQQTIRDFLYSIWNPLKIIIGNPQNLIDDQDHQVQRCIKLLKISMRCIKLRFIEFLQDMFKVVIESYRKYPVSSYIYLLQVSITVFYNVSQYEQYFKSIYQIYVEITSSYLNSQNNLTKYQYLVDDFMGMNKRFFNFNAKIVLNSGKLSQIIQLCINHCFGSEVPKIAKASYQFFQTMFMVYWRTEMIQQYNLDSQNQKFHINSSDINLYMELKVYISQLLPIIIKKMINHLNTCPQRSTIQYILDTLHSQIKAFPQQNCQVWGQILTEIPLDILTKKEKINFYNNLNKIGDTNFQIAQQSDKILIRLLSTIRKRIIYKEKRVNLR